VRPPYDFAMFVWYLIVGTLLAFLALGSGLAKLNGVPQVKTLLDHVGATRIMRPIGYFEIVSAVGLVIGMFYAPIGVASAGGLVLLFLGAVGSHLRVKDPLSQVLNPALPMAIAVLVLWLRFATA
jgi:DoxX-like family